MPVLHRLFRRLTRNDRTASDLGYGFEHLWTERRPRLYFDRASGNASAILSELLARKVREPTQADLLWIRKNASVWYDKLDRFQAINHIPLERCLVRKADLAWTLHRYVPSGSSEFSHRDFLQPTYCLSDAEERMAFVRQLPVKDHPENLWILKPSGLSQGEGVKIVWSFDWLRNDLHKIEEVTLNYEGQPQEYVVQRYIKNVLLLDGKKSEIRIYWLIASLDPLLVLMYPEGTARLTRLPFKLDDFSNPLIHITNIYQQKKYGGNNPDIVLKWDFLRLQNYLTKEKTTPPTFIEEVLRPRLRKILAYIVRANIQHLKKIPQSGHFFGLYGADFILDDQLTPWLTEVQEGPGLSYDDTVKQGVIPPMLRGAAAIVLEILGKKRKGEPVSTLSSTQGFQWVIHQPLVRGGTL
jgi:tubulin polyglutamylase TTLL1